MNEKSEMLEVTNESFLTKIMNDEHDKQSSVAYERRVS